MFYPLTGVDVSLDGRSLVIPAVSVGNVGQLAVDVLISTLSLKKVGYLHDDSFLPLVGNDPFATNGSCGECNMMIAAEVFLSSSHNMAVIQQRSPLVKGKRQQYVEKLMQWIKLCKFSEVVVLTSSYAHERLDSQLIGSQLRYLMSPVLLKNHVTNITDNLKWKELELRPPIVGSGGVGDGDASEIFMPGAGIAKMIYLKCIEEGVPVAVLLTFCSEGDNAGDALQLLCYLNSWKMWIDSQKSDSKASSWKLPSSWKLMYGNRFDPILFR